MYNILKEFSHLLFFKVAKIKFEFNPIKQYIKK